MTKRVTFYFQSPPLKNKNNRREKNNLAENELDVNNKLSFMVIKRMIKPDELFQRSKFSLLNVHNSLH